MPETPSGSTNAPTGEHERKQILVSGTGIDGLTAGLALHDAGHEVTIAGTGEDPEAGPHRSNPAVVVADTTLSRFVDTHARGLAEADEAAAEYRTDVEEYRYLDADGSVLSSFDADCHITATDTLTSRLRDSIPATSIDIEDATDDPHAATHTHPHDIHVTADGWLSETRRRLLPGVTPDYAGYVAWTGTIPEASVPQDLTRQFESAITVSRGSRDLLVAMVLPASDGTTTPGERRLYWVWYSPISPRDLGTVLTGRHGINHDQAVPPGDLQERFVDALRNRAADHAPALTRLVRATPDPGVEPIVDLAVPRAVVDRTAFVGAAAFATRQHTATRVTKSIEDATSLVSALERYDAVDVALADWNHTQTLRGRQLVEQGRQTDLDELVGRA